MSNETTNLPATAERAVIFGGGERGPAYWIAAFIKAARTENTRRTRIADLNAAARTLDCEVPDLLNLSPEGVMHLRDVLTEQGQAPATIHRKLCTLRGLFRYAMARRVIDCNPADVSLVPPPVVPAASSTPWLNRAELRKLLVACQTPIRNTPTARLKALRDYAIVLTMGIHGLRVSELRAMTPAKPEDWNTRRFGACFVREGEQTVLKLRGKGGKDRQHPAHPEVLHAIGAYLAADGSSWLDTDPVFRTHGGRKVGQGITRPALKYILRNRCEQAGVKRVSPHGLRHSNITMLVDAGADVARIADHAGHSNINTTMRYFRDRDSLEKSPINGITLAC